MTISRRHILAAAGAAELGSSWLHAQTPVQTKPYVAQHASLTMNIPAHWKPAPGVPGGLLGVGSDDGYIFALPYVEDGFASSSPVDQPGITEDADDSYPETLKHLNPQRYLVENTDQSLISRAIVIDHPSPIPMYGGNATKVWIQGDSAHFDTIVDSVGVGLDRVKASDLALSIVDIVEGHSYFTSSVDWEAVRAPAADIEQIIGITSYLTYRVLGALRSAGDKHSFMRHMSVASDTGNAVYAPQYPEGHVLDGYGYIAIPATTSFAPGYPLEYATRGSRLRDECARTTVQGWIIDLRNMQGGSVSPPLSVLYPFLPEGKLAGFLDAAGNELWIERSGTSITPENYLIDVPEYPWPPGLDDASIPVAVLTGPNNGSAGEFVQLAMMARDNLTTFGARTAGYCTGNATFYLFNGYAFALATSAELDADRNVYTEDIAPDVLDAELGDAKNMDLDRVVDWLAAGGGT